MKKAFIALGLFLSIVFVASGCRPSKGSLTAEEYLPLIIVSMQSGETAALITRNERIEAEDFQGCVAAEVAAASFEAARKSLSSRLKGSIEFPELTVDLRACQDLPRDEKALKERPAEVIEAVTTTTLDVAGFYASRLRMQDCPKGKAAEAALAYLRVAQAQLLTFLKDPQDTFTLEARVVDFNECYV